MSFPKSGRTWLRYILSFYFSAAFGKNDKTNLHNMFALVPNFDLDPVRGIPAFISQGAAGKVPMVVVSHEARSQLPPKLPIIVMVRDPRDVLVSGYFHATRHKGRFSGSLSDFIDDPDYGMPKMISYLNGWAAGLSGRRHHIVSYENLSAAPVKEIEGVLHFLGCEIKPRVLQAAVDAGQFERMQEMEVAEGIPAHEYDRTDLQSMRMRKGLVGGFREYLNDDEIARIEAYCSRDLTPDAKNLLRATSADFDAPNSQHPQSHQS
ncbi:sulfotransferase domain-containing protein [Pararhizobium sp. YC-54]|uniref:sulfotransferase domain-containing protein n=1 Tax=Pararhizobium sp. YC-54 TaxID=2986920 RepID=UPI0021F6B905|nr:sulfotransferase domain-containing protein [Pararhizobium sp. YC-54]MCV9999558.1 sulfotransferase domain-containing protein [Pararhizobium sp. YC-54]